MVEIFGLSKNKDSALLILSNPFKQRTKFVIRHSKNSSFLNELYNISSYKASRLCRLISVRQACY
jgi:hypothetical protein